MPLETMTIALIRGVPLKQIQMADTSLYHLADRLQVSLSKLLWSSSLLPTVESPENCLPLAVHREMKLLISWSPLRHPRPCTYQEQLILITELLHQ